jgi:probable F420-dependent oxidoreductase
VQFGLIGVNVGPLGTAEGAKAIGQAAESAGFDSIWTFEHVVVPVDYQSRYPYAKGGRAPMLEDVDLPDPLIWLAWVGAHTTDLLLGTGILILPQRSPVVLAKTVASLDHLSAGRVRLGIGVGWLEEEFDAIGVPFARRGKRTDEYIEAMRALWSQDDATFDGEFVSFTNCRSRPAPPNGTTHITIGGHSEVSAKRAGRLGDGFFPAVDAQVYAEGGSAAALDRLEHLITLARRTAEDHDRDPGVLEVSVNWGRAPSPEAMDRMRALGVKRVAVFPTSGDPANLDEPFAELAATLRNL